MKHFPGFPEEVWNILASDLWEYETFPRISWFVGTWNCFRKMGGTKHFLTALLRVWNISNFPYEGYEIFLCWFFKTLRPGMQAKRKDCRDILYKGPCKIHKVPRPGLGDFGPSKKSPLFSSPQKNSYSPSFCKKSSCPLFYPGKEHFAPPFFISKKTPCPPPLLLQKWRSSTFMKTSLCNFLCMICQQPPESRLFLE